MRQLVIAFLSITLAVLMWFKIDHALGALGYHAPPAAPPNWQVAAQSKYLRTHLEHARSHRDGTGVSRNLVKAYKWYSLSIQLCKPVPGCRGKATLERKAIAREMSLQQIEMAESLIANWIPTEKPSTEAVRSLVEQVRNSRGQKRRLAAAQLAEIGPPAKDAVPVLIDALTDKDFSTRIAVATALGSIGPAAKSAISPLAASIRLDPLFTPRHSYAWALAQIGTAAVPALAKELRNLDRIDKDHPGYLVIVFAETMIDTIIVDQLMIMGATAQESIPVLIEALEDDYDYVGQEVRHFASRFYKVAVAGALPELGSTASRAIPALIENLTDSDAQVRTTCAVALSIIDSSSPVALRALRDALKEDAPLQRAVAAEALGNMGQTARSAIPQLKSALNDNDPKVRKAANAALGKITR